MTKLRKTYPFSCNPIEQCRLLQAGPHYNLGRLKIVISNLSEL